MYTYIDINSMFKSNIDILALRDSSPHPTPCYPMLGPPQTTGGRGMGWGREGGSLMSVSHFEHRTLDIYLYTNIVSFINLPDQPVSSS